MASASSRPRLRPVETIVVQDRRLGRALMLRDTQGVTSHAVLPIEVVPIVARFTGKSTCEEIAREASTELGERVPLDLVTKLATELEDALFVDGPPYRRERARIEREFASAAVREASHAGGAYHGDPIELAEYIDVECLGTRAGKGRDAPRATNSGNPARATNGGSPARATNGGSPARATNSGSPARATNGGSPARAANGRNPTRTADGGDATNGAEATRARLVGLVAPHIDPWRGARCYGAAYRALAAALPDDVETFVLLGTSHAPMREPFALCRKTFATPLGPMEADFDAIDAIATACDFDPYADQFNHKREHSLEFQAVFLRHLLGKRRARIIPILAGLGAHQQSGESPTRSRSVTRFYDALRKIVDRRSAVVIAGADLAHVGPRFGDPRALDEAERTRLDSVDRDSLARAERVDAEAFWEHVASDLDSRRVCGLGPMYSLLRTIDPSARGEVRHYEQTVDPEEGSIVSHAAVGFYA
ncbi:MAG: AmmeMemoRadiSam system protein B [Labilithrix sp.]|nr:AmmeMemoRadiSam system protein B [Labilithrix sp.]